MFFLFLTMAAIMPQQETAPRSVSVKENVGQGEAVEFLLKDAREGDVINWLILSPSDLELKTFEHGTSFIVDPPVDFSGRIRVVCRVANFDTREIKDIDAFTMVGVSANQGAEVAVSQPAAPAKIITLREISKQNAPEYNGQVYGIWKKASERIENGIPIGAVNKELVDQLNESRVTGWQRHFETVFNSLNGQSSDRAAELYLEIAEGIKDLRE
jgi:hypothetical protein